jgi:circadian clock protein KaiC
LTDASSSPRAATGVAGLDHILRGGLPRNLFYLVHGGPGTGKTTLGMQFLTEGLRQGERVLYISLLKTREELERFMASHNWSLEGIDLLDLPDNVRRLATDEQTFFNTADVELREVNDAILQAVERTKPQRLVFDSISELALLVDNQYQLRRQLLRLKQKLEGMNCTTLFLLIETETVDMPTIQTVIQGAIQLGMDEADYGPPRRWLNVTKMMAPNYIAGRHDMHLATDGLTVYPRLQVPPKERQADWPMVSSGIEQIDTLFGGGLEEGTACLVTGSTGAGKSTLASLYVQAAARRGDRSLVFCFDERRQTFIRRAQNLSLEIVKHIDRGLVDLRQVNVGELLPGQFVQDIRGAVEDDGVKVIVIDSIGGYLSAMPGREHLVVQLHELLSYLSAAGVLTLMVAPVHDVTGDAVGEATTSYIADTVVLMRVFEAAGRMRRCISVLKKRHGDHEKTVRELTIGAEGIVVGKPLHRFSGVLSGTPTFLGDVNELLEPDGEDE